MSLATFVLCRVQLFVCVMFPATKGSVAPKPADQDEDSESQKTAQDKLLTFPGDIKPRISKPQVSMALKASPCGVSVRGPPEKQNEQTTYKAWAEPLLT